MYRYTHLEEDKMVKERFLAPWELVYCLPGEITSEKMLFAMLDAPDFSLSLSLYGDTIIVKKEQSQKYGKFFKKFEQWKENPNRGSISEWIEKYREKKNQIGKE